MHCPNCEKHSTKVIDTCRAGAITYRKRECKLCGEVFVTSEEYFAPNYPKGVQHTPAKRVNVSEIPEESPRISVDTLAAMMGMCRAPRSED